MNTQNSKLAIYYDAEFTGLHKNTTLISIGFVSTTGSTFYAEFTDYDKNQVNEWIEKNVIANLMLDQEKAEINDKINLRVKGDSSVIRTELLKWLKNEYEVSGKQIQLFTDCYAYDWVLLMDLICDDGKALNIPEYIHYIPIDLSTTLFNIDVDPDINREEFIDIINLPMNIKKHNSLWDAYVTKKCFDKYNAISIEDDLPFNSIFTSTKSKIKAMVKDILNKYRNTPYDEGFNDKLYTELLNKFAEEYPNYGRSEEINKTPFPDAILCFMLEDNGYDIDSIYDFKYVDIKFIMDNYGCLDIKIVAELSENYKPPRNYKKEYNNMISCHN